VAAQAKPILPEPRSLRVWTLLALVAVLISYLLNLLIGILCLILPFWVLERSPLWGILLLLFGAIAGITILWSSIPRPQKFKPPGVLLDLVKHPKLAAEIESIAAALAEPMPREVYLVLAPNAFVAEPGDAGEFLALVCPFWERSRSRSSEPSWLMSSRTFTAATPAWDRGSIPPARAWFEF